MEEFGDSAELVHNRGGLVSVKEELLSFVSNKSEMISEKFALTFGDGVVLTLHFFQDLHSTYGFNYRIIQPNSWHYTILCFCSLSSHMIISNISILLKLYSNCAEVTQVHQCSPFQ